MCGNDENSVDSDDSRASSEDPSSNSDPLTSHENMDTLEIQDNELNTEPHAEEPTTSTNAVPTCSTVTTNDDSNSEVSSPKRYRQTKLTDFVSTALTNRNANIPSPSSSHPQLRINISSSTFQKASAKKRKKPQSIEPTNADGDNTSETQSQSSKTQQGNVQHLSIHRLPVQQLRNKLSSGQQVSEDELIDKVITSINNTRTAKINKFLPQGTPSEFEDSSYGFTLKIFTQDVKHGDKLLGKFGIEPSKSLRSRNTLIFYFRENCIYALTTHQVWQSIQKYCCYEFPCQIAGRLTSDDGYLMETAYSITGNEKISNKTNRNPERFNKIEKIRLGFTKPLSQKSSLYGLQEFQHTSAHQKQKAINRINLKVGLAYVRILKKMNVKNIPEILDHFSTICDGSPTSTHPDGDPEYDVDEFPYIQPVSNETADNLDATLNSILHSFIYPRDNQRVDNQINQLDIVHKHVQDYFMAENIKLFCENDEKFAFPAPPTAFQLFTEIRNTCGNELLGNDPENQMKHFSAKLNDITLQYTIGGSTDIKKVKILQLVDGEVKYENEAFWKLMGRWWSLREDYYFEINTAFLELLNEHEIILTTALREWNREQMQTVDQYVALYMNYDDVEHREIYYFNPPATPTHEIERRHYFDMISVREDLNGDLTYNLFYILHSVRFSSTKIHKSLDKLLKDNTASAEMFRQFQNLHANRERYQEMFGGATSFRSLLTRLEVTVAFVTDDQQGNGIAATLQRESTLHRYFDEEIIIRVLEEVQPQNLSIMWNESGHNEQIINMQQLSEFLLGRLYEHGYCSVQDGNGYEVLGKFLKLQDSVTFRIFDNPDVNEDLFEVLKRYYITGFPGFIHKLECLQIYKNVSNKMRLKLRFADIPLAYR